MKKLNLGLLVLFYVIKLSAQTPLADVRVSSSSPTENFGDRTTITTRLDSYEAYLQFDVRGLSGQVKLQLFGNIHSTGNDVSVGVYPTDSSWSETELVWNNKPATGDIICSTLILDTTPRLYEWDLSSYIQAEKSAGHNIVSIAIKSIDSSSSYLSFNSK